MQYLILPLCLIVFIACGMWVSFHVRKRERVLRDARKARGERANELALQCTPQYQTWHASIRAHELATAQLRIKEGELLLKQRELAFKEWQARTQITLPQYGMLIHKELAETLTLAAPVHKPMAKAVITETESEATPILSFRELLEAGTVQLALAQGKMLLGYANGQMRYGSWLDLYSCAVGGVSGSGKSTTVRFLLFQAVMAGAQLIMVDPHIMDEEESLAAQFRAFPQAHLYPPCDARAAAVLKRIRALAKELDRRKATGIKEPGLVLVIDEYNAIMRSNEQVREELAALLLDIAQEGRKFGMFAMLIGQRWSAQDIGGADIRSSLASMLAHRFTDEEQAKKLVGGKHAPKCLELPQGHFLFRDTDGVLTEMITPLTIVEDGAYIVRLLQNGSQTSSSNHFEDEESPQNGSYVEALPAPQNGSKNGSQPVDKTVEAAPELQEKVKLVLGLHAEGKNMAEVIKAVWGVAPTKSPAYEQAKQEYQQVMRLANEALHSRKG